MVVVLVVELKLILSIKKKKKFKNQMKLTKKIALATDRLQTMLLSSHTQREKKCHSNSPGKHCHAHLAYQQQQTTAQAVIQKFRLVDGIHVIK